MRAALWILALVTALGVSACGGGGGDSTSTPPPPSSSQTPDVTSIGPTAGPPGTTVTIQGVNFGSTASANVVKFNGVQANITSASSTKLVVTVPPGATTGKLTIETGDWILTINADFIVSSLAPSISGFTPRKGVNGTSVTITGTNFSPTAADNLVWINGYAATVTAATSTSLTIKVPPGASPGVLTVQTAGGSVESTESFTPLPTVTGFSPTSGWPGSEVTITGTNLAGSTVYFWNGYRAYGNSYTSTSVTVQIPNGAKTGPLSLETSNGYETIRTSADFQVTSQYVPTVTSFSPEFGKAGTSVTVRGANFDRTAANNIVKFSGVAGTVTLVSVDSLDPYLKVTVPVVGGTGPISVTTAEGTGTSTGYFAFQDSPPTGRFVSASASSISAGNVMVGEVFFGSVTLTNTGTLPVRVSQASVSGTGFAYYGSTCYGYQADMAWHDTLAAGASCTVDVMYAPTAAGSSSGTLTIPTSATSGAVVVSLTGNATPKLVPEVLLEPTTLTFASRELGTTSLPQVVRLSNPGNAPLNISGIYAGGEFEQTNSCPPSLPAGSSCTINVSFKPIRFAEVKKGSLSVLSNAKGSPHGIYLEGTGTLAKSGQLAIYTRHTWGVDHVWVDDTWVGGNLKPDAVNTCGGYGAVTVTLPPGTHTVEAADNILMFTEASVTVTEGGCTVHQVVGTSACAAPNFVSGGYCYPPIEPVCVAPQILQNGACVTPGGSTGSGSGGGGSGGGAGGGSPSGAMAAEFDDSGGGSDAAGCLTFGMQDSPYEGHDSQTITNGCPFTVYVMHCHSESSRSGTKSSQCGYQDRFFQQFYWLKPGEVQANFFNLPPDASIWYGACSGGDLPSGKQVSLTGRYICK